MSKFKMFVCVGMALSLNVGTAQAETEKQCLEKKSNPIFWRQQIRDCSRADVLLFGGAQSANKARVVSLLVDELKSPPPGGGEVTGLKWILLGQPSYALEIEPFDQVDLNFGHCSKSYDKPVDAAFKHEVSFSAEQEDGGALIGEAVVYRADNGEVICVSTRSVTSSEIIEIQ